MTVRQATATIAASDEDERIRAREATILGEQPRIPPMEPDEFSEEARQSSRNLRSAVGLSPEGPVPEYVATVLRHPSLYRDHTTLALRLMNGTLTPRDRELAVLRTGWLCAAPFEWGEHVAIGKRTAGLTNKEIEWAVIGSTAPGWTTHDRAIIRAVEELFEHAMISDETWTTLAATLDEQQLMELPILIGQYQGVAYLQNSLRVRLMPKNPGLTAR